MPAGSPNIPSTVREPVRECLQLGPHEYPALHCWPHSLPRGGGGPCLPGARVHHCRQVAFLFRVGGIWRAFLSEACMTFMHHDHALLVNVTDSDLVFLNDL